MRLLLYSLLPALLLLAAACDSERSDTEEAAGVPLPEVPRSEYVDSSRVLARTASPDSVFAWVAPSTRGALTTLQNTLPPTGTYLSLEVLVQNGSSEPVVLSPRAAFLRHRTGTRTAFKGQQWPPPADTVQFHWLGPGVYELEGNDVSRMGMDDIELQPGAYASTRVSFSVPDTVTTQSALGGIEELLFPYVPEERSPAFLRLQP